MKHGGRNKPLAQFCWEAADGDPFLAIDLAIRYIKARGNQHVHDVQTFERWRLQRRMQAQLLREAA